MSFRSMFLLRRSTDLEEMEREHDEDAAEGRIEGGVLIVETRPEELSHLAAILENLDQQTLSVSGDSVALRMIRDHAPKIVVSSRALPGLEGYILRRDLPEQGPFLYLRDSDGTGDSSEERLLKEVGESVAEEKNRSDESVRSVQWKKPVSEEIPATAEEILKGFRDSDSEEEVDSSEQAERSLESPIAAAEEEDEELARIQKYRAEYQAQRSVPEPDSVQATHDSLEDPFNPWSQSSEQERSPAFKAQERMEEDVRSDSMLPQGDRIPSDSADYSIIERIDAEEIATLSHGDVLSEDTNQGDPSPKLDLYQESRSYVLDSIRAVDGGNIPDLVKGESIAERIVSSVEGGSELLLSATDRRQEFAISSHSVNTCVFAVRIATALGLSRWQQLRIALAALLHEIGVVRLPKQLVYKTEKPTLEEIKILRQRPVYAARSLKGVDSRYDWLGEVVGQVYERENGTGYPLGLTGREICEESKVIGIADLFDACIHRRPYREALTGYQALFELTTDQARTFSDRIVKALIKSLSLFPYNEFVVLSSGEIGKVVEINLENLSRPVIEVLYDKEGKAVETAKPIDLAQNPSLYISKALPYRNLPSNSAG